MTPDYRRRFDSLGEIYARHRPSYPAALLDWIAATTGVAPPADVLDVGCGTGIATRLFAERGYRTVGVDPSPGMLEEARRAGGGPRYELGDSAATGRPDASADLIVSAQAFHWFDFEPTLVEFRRVLRPGGWCATFWNNRTDETAFLREYEELLYAFLPEHGQRRGMLKPLIAEIRASPLVADSREASFPNAQPLDREALIGRVFSCSFVHHDVEKKDEFRARLNELFDRHQQGGLVDLRYEAIVVAWRFA